MSERKRWLTLYLIGLLIYGAAASRVQSPGYMDADYYYATALQLADGQGLSEPFLWNYLDDPAGLPHASHQYWMPLPSFLSAASMLLFGTSFRAAQLPFVLIAALLAPLAAFFSMRISRSARMAWMAGLLAMFPGFFLPFLVTVDSFAIFAIAGSLSLWMMARSVTAPTSGRWFLAGLLVGVSSLARADGMLLLAIGLLAVIWSKPPRISGALLFLGFLVVMAPWWVRNLGATGTVFNSGSQRLLWMLNYNDLFAFPASKLSLDRWLEAGIAAAVQARLAAFSTNLQRIIAEAGLLFLTPFIALGAIRKWDHPFVRLGMIYLAMLVVVMTLVFPFVGPRGALFHSMSAVMPLLWALAPIGLRDAIYWLGHKREWNRLEAWRVLGASAVMMAALLTFSLYGSRFFGEGNTWNASAETYRRVGAAFPDPDSAVYAVNNPPGFFAHSHKSAVVIPDGSVDTLRKAVDSYGVRWVILEANHPEGLNTLYNQPESVSWLKLFKTIDSAGGQPVYVLEVVR